MFKVAIGFLCAAMIVCAFTILGNGSPKRGVDTFELQANCIAEYDYQHPRSAVMDNLEDALSICTR